MTAHRIEQLAEGVTLMLGDCRELLPTLGRFDAVVTDPPYLGLKGGVVHRRFGGLARKQVLSVSVGDEWNANLEWAQPCEAICNKAIAVFCSHSGVADVRAAFKSEAVSLAVWHKRNAAPAINNVPRQTTEFIWLFKTGPNARWRSITDTLFSVNSANAGCVTTGERLIGDDGKAIHPTQKPVAIMEPFVLLVDRDESILDPFMGLCTTGLAAIKHGRKFTGIEINEHYFDISCRRVEAALRQPDMFVAPPAPIKQEALDI